jgi:glucosylceramidase
VNVVPVEYYQLWADYFVRFLDEYAALGIDFWGLTAQNEPVNGNTPDFSFNCMGWNASTQRQWVEENAGPTLESAGYGDVKFMIADEQRPAVPKWVREVFESEGKCRLSDCVLILYDLVFVVKEQW